MAKPIISIIGLGTTGASLGLALQQDEGNFELVGHDKSPDATKQASKLGAVNRTEWNLHRACENAEMIVLAMPLSEARDTLEHIAEDLTPGRMVFTATNMMEPAVKVADGLLPEGVHFVAGHPILPSAGDDPTPRADLFVEAIFCLAPGLQTDPDAVQLASDFVERVGAKPLYVDPYEHDGIIAGVELLPQLLSAALMRSSSHAAGWQESRKLAGRRFALATEPGGTPRQMYEAFMADRDNLLVRLDQFQEELNTWRSLLNTDDPAGDEEHPLFSALDETIDARLDWESQVKFKQWSDPSDVAVPERSSGGIMRQMFFGNMFSRRATKEDDEK